MSADDQRYLIWPLVKQADGSWNIDDEILLLAWYRMVETERAQTVFYQGTVRTPQEWLSWVKNPQNMVCLGVDLMKTALAGVAWLNHMTNGIAYAHFCLFSQASWKLGKKVVDYWSAFSNGDGKPLFKTIIGLTPETYDKAIRYIRLLGFNPVGVVPNLCNLVYENRRVGGLISYYCPSRKE